MGIKPRSKETLKKKALGNVGPNEHQVILRQKTKIRKQQKVRQARTQGR